MAYLSETHFYSSVGDTRNGLAVCYGTCTTGDQIIAQVQYLATGTEVNCSQVHVVPFPGSDTVEVLLCNGAPMAAYSRDLMLVSATACGCPQTVLYAGTPHSFGCTVAVAQSTWGSIKALYRD